MTLQECKDEIGKKYRFITWENLAKHHENDTAHFEQFFDEAAELYAKSKAIEFAESTAMLCYMFDIENDNWILYPSQPTETKTTTELYDIFNK